MIFKSAELMLNISGIPGIKEYLVNFLCISSNFVIKLKRECDCLNLELQVWRNEYHASMMWIKWCYQLTKPEAFLMVCR